MTNTLLEIEDLTVRYRRRAGGRGQPASSEAIAGVGLRVDPGEFVSIVGESGSGKSTTIHAALGILPRNAEIAGGRIRLDGQDVTGWSDRRFSQLRGPFVGFIPQDPGTSLNPVKRVGQQVLEAILLHRPRRERAGAKELAVRKLRQAGLPSPERVFAQYPYQLSGGMKQRVLIAIALASDPKLLIADEPTSALDVRVQKVILDHLGQLRDQLGLGVLLVTHDLGIAADRVDRLVVMQRGRIVEAGSAAGVLGAPATDYTRELIDAAPSFHSARLTPAHPAAPRPAPGPRSTAGPALLEVSQVSKRYPALFEGRASSIAAVDAVSLRVQPGSTHAVVGESGAGKSTLARIAVGLIKPDAGTVRLAGTQISGLSRRQLRGIRRDVQLVYQNPFASLDPRFTVERIVAEPLEAHRVVTDRAARAARVGELLDKVALDRSYLGRKAEELSGGQRQRVAIARALALNPRLVVLDEAVSALDVSIQAQILRLLVDLQAQLGLSYLFITHDLGVVRLIADEVTVMRDGRAIETGPVEQVFNNPRSEYTRDLIDAVPGINGSRVGIGRAV